MPTLEKEYLDDEASLEWEEETGKNLDNHDHPAPTDINCLDTSPPAYPFRTQRINSNEHRELRTKRLQTPHNKRSKRDATKPFDTSA